MEGTGASGGFLFSLPILFILIYIVLFGVGVYCLILFIQLARRGIQALDLYIAEKKSEKGGRQ
ncbi:hypothetical protein [Cohnella nanjingensis]|uniref:Uncharacterized protein n=1 Tax=Cohnella nanjingensis TaxID=1387779 RepID=A0A7X0RUF8_9BACL|nr:hypothetical protein [Cohnella nanjingensis]MBB6672691.1 hypothetical protein [Cohnella nanjingensis]